MSGWNLPPGVTGAEFAIAGPDAEYEDVHWCTACDREASGLVQSYRSDAWFSCDTCGAQTLVNPIAAGLVPDPDHEVRR